MKTAEFMQKFIENWRLFRENPKIRRLPKTVITQDIEQMLLLSPQHVDNLCKLLKFVPRVGKNA